MFGKVKRFCLELYLLPILFVVLTIGCGSGEPVPTQTVVAKASETAVSGITSTSTRTPQPTNTATPTKTAVPSQTPIPLPLDPMTPFPTVTPDYVIYGTKPVFIALTGCCGDGGSETDYVRGRDVPSLIIYGDGQIIITDGRMGDKTYLEAYLTPQEMCQLRQQIAETGFLEPHDTFFTERDGSMGAGSLSIQVEEVYYSFYSGDVRFLVDDLAAGYQLIRNYRPQSNFVTYIPQYLVLWIEEVQPDANDAVNSWPSHLPPITELWVNHDKTTLFVEGDLVSSIYELFEYENREMLFQDGEIVYSIIARPILPDETPRHYPVFLSLPRDYVPVLNCDEEPTLISPSVPTATPTLTSPTTTLTGQGRIAFTFGSFWEHDIYVMEADGSNLLRLTNDQYINGEPAWSPDGQQIAFASRRGENLDIYVMNADGTDVKRLTDHIYDDYSPSWSPDGAKIAFVSDRDGSWQTSEIYTMNADGSEQTRLTYNETRDLSPVWSPDGQNIAYVQELEHGITSALVILNLKDNTTDSIYVDQPGASEERFSYSSYRISRPAWSPDRTRIAITVLPNLPSVIRILDLNGIEIQTFDVSPLDQRDALNWSADGSLILFSARKPNEGENAVHYSEDQSYFGNWGIYALDVKTGEVIQITFSQQDEMSPALWP